jgi:hypothetical protein
MLESGGEEKKERERERSGEAWDRAIATARRLVAICGEGFWRRRPQ